MIKSVRAASASVIMASVAAFTAALPTSVGVAASYAPPACPASVVSLIAGQPTDSGVLQVARVAGKQAGAPDMWDLKYDPWFCNKTSRNYTATNAKIEFLNSSGGVTLTTNTPVYTGPSSGYWRALSLPAGSGATPGFVRPGEPTSGAKAYGGTPKLFAYPLPTQLRFTLVLAGSDGTTATFVRTYGVAEQKSPGPVGGFFFPLRQSGLPVPNAHYTSGYHEDYNTFQRYALDIGAVRWDSTIGNWSAYRADTDHNKKESAVIWDNPVYAMSDGQVLSCVRGAPDNEPTWVDGKPLANPPPQDANPGGGNMLWVKTGTQTQLYAHMQYHSIPTSICPASTGEDTEHSVVPNNIFIKAGQLLGRVGNSGSTSGPHTHVHTMMGTSNIFGGWDAEIGYGSDPRPMNFINVQVQPLVSKTDASAGLWKTVSPARVLPYGTLIAPNSCGKDPSRYTGSEIVQVAVPGSCWAETYNAMVQAGLRPIHYDSRASGSTVSITSIWRRNDGTPWLFFNGLDGAGLQSVHNTYTAQGYRYLDIEGYAENNLPRYAVIFVKQPGQPFHAYAGMSPSTYSTTFTNEYNAGYRLVNVSVAVISGAKQYTGLWVKANVGSYVVKDVSVAGFGSDFTAQTNAGRKLISVNAYELGGTPYLSTVWYSAMNQGWTTYYDQTYSQLNSQQASNLAAGRYARSVTEYLSGGVSKYAGLWRAISNTAINSGPSGTTPSTSATFTFSSPDDPLATFECKLDLGAWADCASAKSYSGLAVGSHTFSVRARDFQGLRDATPATRTWSVG